MGNRKERRGEEDRLREVMRMWMLLRRTVRWRRWTTIERLKDMIVLGCACVHHADDGRTRGARRRLAALIGGSMSDFTISTHIGNEIIYTHFSLVG